MDFWAHTSQDRLPELLHEHLENVAALAGRFAASWGAADWGRLAGLWHDLGKYQADFQRRIRGENIRVDHADPAAAGVWNGRDSRTWPLAFVIAGHHAGLANLKVRGDSSITPLQQRICEHLKQWCEIEAGVSEAYHPRSAALPGWPAWLDPHRNPQRDQGDLCRSLELWTRFLFSALVDADFLATEQYFDPSLPQQRGRYDSLTVLRDRLNAHLSYFFADSPVNRIRAKILADCRQRAAESPGLFSLTVPTGGGKTLSGLAFALDHAIAHGKQRVIVAIPYTSIIEQAAGVYRDILGLASVLEHHAAIDTDQRERDDQELEIRRRLAAENWDAPVIVTTNVQLLESLLANRTSRCRKLHNIADSVIILDEAQCLPLHLLITVKDVLNELADHYHCSIVLSTATQPALARPDDDSALKNVREIVADPDDLFHRLRRVRVTWPDPDAPPTPYEQLAGQLCEHRRVLAIVHRRDDARQLAQLLAGQGVFHLSALMCPAHRQQVLAEIKHELTQTDQPVRLIATQLVEAGVDIDFPIVYRALAGLDSIAQAAGRCDREGRLTAAAGQPAGDVRVFLAETQPPPGVLRIGLETTRSLLRMHTGQLDLADPQLYDTYFRMLYQKTSQDPSGIQTDRASLNFANVAQKFELIEDRHTVPLVVPFGSSPDRLAAYDRQPTIRTLRALQPFIVQITPGQHAVLAGMGALTKIQDTVTTLSSQYENLYDNTLGLQVDETIPPDPRKLIG